MDADGSLDHVFFPDSGVVSVVAVYADGGVIEMATIGREGCTGMQAYFGAKTSSVRLLVQIPGSAAKMSRAAFVRAMESMPSFRNLMSAYIHALLEQVLVSGACYGAHSLKERLAPGDYDQLHHLIADGVWDAAPSESELLVHADDRLDGGKRHPCLEGRCVVPARSSAYALSCSRRFSPLSGRNSTYRPAQISGTGSDAALGNRDFFLNEPYSIGGSRCKSITMKE